MRFRGVQRVEDVAVVRWMRRVDERDGGVGLGSNASARGWPSRAVRREDDDAGSLGDAEGGGDDGLDSLRLRASEEGDPRRVEPSVRPRRPDSRVDEEIRDAPTEVRAG